MKSKFIALALVGILVSSSAVSAYAATPLTAVCTGTPTATSITWNGSASGGVSPYTFLWGNGSTSASQTVASAIGTFTMNFQVTDASSTIATTTCTAKVQEATSTVAIKRIAKLHIEQNGNVEAKAMIVKSAGSGSFTAEIWGITYTVTSTTPVVVGDYVDVVGKIDSGTPLVIVAKHVRDYPATKVVKTKKDLLLEFFHGNKNSEKGKSESRGEGKGKGGHDD